jgi:hypothetical protein
MLTIFLSILAAESPAAGTPTALASDTSVVVAESDLVTVLGSAGTPSQVALLTANKPQENALAKVVDESHGYRYLRAGSASEVRGSLREAGMSCGVFLAPKGSESWRATLVGDCATPVAAAKPPSSGAATGSP